MWLGVRRFPLTEGALKHALSAVTKLCIFAGTTIVGYVGWYAGELLGFEFFGCFMLSGVGSVVGVWLGWKLGRRFE